MTKWDLSQKLKIDFNILISINAIHFINRIERKMIKAAQKI